MCLCLLLSWTIVYLCILKGVKSSGKVRAGWSPLGGGPTAMLTSACNPAPPGKWDPQTASAGFKIFWGCLAHSDTSRAGTPALLQPKDPRVMCSTLGTGHGAALMPSSPSWLCSPTGRVLHCHLPIPHPGDAAHSWCDPGGGLEGDPVLPHTPV